ncbi:MAG TPA: ATP-binding protein [Pyrinomonadaceae bacterium]|nr:ATP-binding protein [Pyrinomonadaceae bacterium]
MWIPKTEEEIIDAAANRTLEETITFDGKREISSKNIEIAKDISAFANTSGGVLIYGLAEDSDGKLAILNPIKLKGERERIDQIVRTAIDEVPFIKITAIETQHDPSIGYLIVIVPPSERAPHMVIVKGESRYYGRAATGNCVLNQANVAQLFERRRVAEQSIVPQLEQAIKEAPLPDNDKFAHLHIVARPALADDTLLDRCVLSGRNHKELLTEVLDQVSRSGIYRDGYVPDIGYPGSGWARRPEGYYGKCHYGPEEDMGVHFQFNLDGSAWLFSGRAAEAHGEGDPKTFFSSIVAGTTTKFLAVLGELYDRANYLGMVDIGLAVTGLQGCAPELTRDAFRTLPKFSRPDYHRTARSNALLLKDDPKSVAARLVMPLVEAISQGTDDPFKNR